MNGSLKKLYNTVAAENLIQVRLALHVTVQTDVNIVCYSVSAGGHPGDRDQINQYDDNTGRFALSVVSVHKCTSVTVFVSVLYTCVCVCFQRPQQRWEPLQGLLVLLPWRWLVQSAVTSPTRRRSCALAYSVRLLLQLPVLTLLHCISSKYTV